ncbi:tetratricopeptide repeat protein 16 [Diplonema papillatum]|nr:tetratricopeptide repeat protein 16 [Diplonema papillatum]
MTSSRGKMRESLGDAEQGPSAGAGEKDEPPDAENAPEPQHEEGSDWITSSRANDHYTEGLRRVRGRDFLSAYRSFTKAIFLLPEEPILYVARAETCINLCDLSSAASNYRKATTLQSPPDAAHFDRLVAVLDTLGLAAFCEGRIERALEYFNSALEYTPCQKGILLHRSLCLFMFKQHKEALRDAEICTDASPPTPFVWVAKTVFHMMGNRISEAKDSLERCLAMAAHQPLVTSLQMSFDAFYNRFKGQAFAAIEDERWSFAEKQLGTCIAAFPHDSELYLARSGVLCSQQKYTAAVQDLFESINMAGEATPKCSAQLSATLTRIAEELFAKNSIRQAINYCEESLKWNPDHVSALLLRGECLKVLGDHESAMKDFKRVLEVDGANDEGVWRLGNLHASWGTLLYAQQKYGLAEREFSRAISYSALEPMHHINRAKCLLMLQQPSAAVREYVACWKISKQDPSVMKLLRKLCPAAIQRAVETHTADDEPSDLRPFGDSGILVARRPSFQPTDTFQQRSSRRGKQRNGTTRSQRQPQACHLPIALNFSACKASVLPTLPQQTR